MTAGAAVAGGITFRKNGALAGHVEFIEHLTGGTGIITMNASPHNTNACESSALRFQVGIREVRTAAAIALALLGGVGSRDSEDGRFEAEDRVDNVLGVAAAELAVVREADRSRADLGL